MKGQNKTKQQLLSELADLRQRVAHLEALEAEQRQTEAALIHERDLAHILMDNIPDRIYFKDATSHFTHINKAQAQVLGVSEPGQAIGKTDHDFFEVDLARKFYADEQEIVKSGQPLIGKVEESLGPDRRFRWVSTTKVPIVKGGRVTGIVGISRDITERKQAEEALQKARDELEQRVQERTAQLARANQELQVEIADRKEAEDKLRHAADRQALLYQILRAVSGQLGPDAVAHLAVKAIAEFAGWPHICFAMPNEAKTHWVIRAADGELAAEVGMTCPMNQGVIGRAFRTTQIQLVRDVRTDPAYKGERPVLLSELAVPIKQDERILAVLNLESDRLAAFGTEEVQLAESLAEVIALALENARLYEAAQIELAERKLAEKTLQQRNRELAALNVELQARNEELDAFAHTVAHDLQNPLAVITGLAEQLEESYATLPEEELRRYLRAMSQSGRKMSNIVDGLLLLAGVRKAEVERQPLDMAGVVAEARQRLIDLARERQADIILPSTWPVALGHTSWVEEVWVNYLSNAIQYGGQPPRVELGAQVQSDGMVRFWVRDNGNGIAPDTLGRLFTPFTRLNQIRARGHGLGLSIVRRIVEKLGGQVGVESQVGQGSTFFFTLPAAPKLPAGPL